MQDSIEKNRHRAARCIQKAWVSLPVDDVFFYRRYPVRFAVRAEDGCVYDARPLYKWLHHEAMRDHFRGCLLLPTRTPVSSV
eukprot:1360852-Pleurochrysis_carterae.AAC.1